MFVKFKGLFEIVSGKNSVWCVCWKIKCLLISMKIKHITVLYESWTDHWKIKMFFVFVYVFVDNISQDNRLIEDISLYL